MPGVDLPPAELQRYRCRDQEPADFDHRWERSLAEARNLSWAPRVVPVENGLRLVRSWDVTFAGFGGEPVRAWLSAPADVRGPLPVVVHYNGYGGGRGLPLEHTTWANAGIAELFTDTRGQGASWGSGGDTPDPHGSGPAGPGWMTRGVESFETSYLHRLEVDAVMAVDAARQLDVVDPERVVVAGTSQGGGLALAAAGLCVGLAACMADVPFLCDVRRGVEVSPTDPYGEVARYLAVHRDRVDQVMTTLAYVDGVHHAARATAPALLSVALWDDVCPPSTVYAAHAAYGGPKELVVYPFNQHEGGQAHQVARQLAWLPRVLGLAPTAATAAAP